MNEENTSSDRRALVTATFSRRSPPLTIDSTEIDRKLAVCVSTEGDRKIHDVAFVALHVLEVFDRRRLNPLIGKEPFEFRGASEGLVE